MLLILQSAGDVEVFHNEARLHTDFGRVLLGVVLNFGETCRLVDSIMECIVGFWHDRGLVLLLPRKHLLVKGHANPRADVLKDLLCSFWRLDEVITIKDERVIVKVLFDPLVYFD